MIQRNLSKNVFKGYLILKFSWLEEFHLDGWRNFPVRFLSGEHLTSSITNTA